MNRSRAVGVASVALLVALSSSVANAGQPTLKGDKPPAHGHWKLKVGPSPSSKTGGGSFVVTKAHVVKKMHITVNPDDVAACGAGKKFTVIGAKKLHKIYNGNGQDEWVIGKYVAGQTPSYNAIKTSVHGNGQTYKAKMEMSFNSRSDTDTRTYGYVAVKVTGSICFLDFTFKKV